MHKYTSRGERGRRREGGQSAQEEDKLAFYIRGHPGFIRSRDSTASERYVTSMWNVESVSPDLRASRRDTHLAKEATARAFVKRGPSRGRERERERERQRPLKENGASIRYKMTARMAFGRGVTFLKWQRSREFFRSCYRGTTRSRCSISADELNLRSPDNSARHRESLTLSHTRAVFSGAR